MSTALIEHLATVTRWRAYVRQLAQDNVDVQTLIYVHESRALNAHYPLVRDAELRIVDALMSAIEMIQAELVSAACVVVDVERDYIEQAQS